MQTTPSPPLFQNLVLGTDLVFVPRLQKSLTRFGEAFFTRLLTPAEMTYCHDKSRGKPELFLKSAAGKIAVKEAVSKALGIGISGLGWRQGAGWHEIETITQSQSPPELRLSGRALERAKNLGLQTWRVSLSHDGDYATATAIGLI